MHYNIDKKIYYINVFSLLCISMIILYLLYANLKQQYESLIKEAENKTEVLARVISTDLDRFIFGVEELMEGIDNAEEHIHESPYHEQEIEALLIKNLRPYIMDILIVNKEAEIIHWTRNQKKPDITTREYITHHLRKEYSYSTYIGEPQLSKVHKDKWFFAISKPFYTLGKFKHIIVMILDLEFFNKRYRSSLSSENSSIFIGSTEGRIYARYPHKLSYIGKQIEEIKSFSYSKKEIQQYTIPSPLDNKERIATLIRSNNYPIITGNSLLTQEVLGSWKKQKTKTLFIALVIGLGFIALTIYYTRLQQKLINLSQKDGLTQVYNRGFFIHKANQEFSRARRLKENLSIIMIDIDDFKPINDTHGHQKGDSVIKLLSQSIIKNIRDFDTCARYGGEEFIILLHQTNATEALKVAERIKDEFNHHKKNQLKITASFGVATIKHKEDKNIEAIIYRADKALYCSKDEGKNTINIIA